MDAPDSVETKQSKQRASIKWLLSKAFNNRVPENLQEPFYRDHEEQEHLKPPIVGGLANAELYCLALANMYSDPNYHSLNHWNILQTLARKGVSVQQPGDCALTETVLIQTNPLRVSAHMAVIEALMSLYAREVVTLDRVSAASQRFGTSQPLLTGSSIPHEDGLLCWLNSACAALNKAEEDTSNHVPSVQNLQDICDGTALAALISFYCPEALPRGSVRVGRMSSIQDCLHNLMLVYDFCQHYLPYNVFHMMPEDVTYMRGSMKQNLIALLADLFNMLEVHPAKCVKYPAIDSSDCNEYGVRHKRCLPPPPPQPIPDLRPDLDSSNPQPFTVPRSPSACAIRPRAPTGRSACSTPERRSCSPLRDQFVVHRGKGVTTLSSMARRDDDTVSQCSTADSCMTTAVPAGRPSHYGEGRDSGFAGRRSRRSSISDDSQLTVENFGGSQDRLHFAGRNPEKELATVAAVRKISAPAGPHYYNPPIRTSKQDTRGSIQFFHGDYQNGTSQDEKSKLERQTSQPEENHYPIKRQNSQLISQFSPSQEENYYPMKRQLSSDTLNHGYSHKGGGDAFYLNRDSTDGDGSKVALGERLRSNGDQQGIQSHSKDSEPQTERRKSTTYAPQPSNVTTWQQQFRQQEIQQNGNDEKSDEDLNNSADQAMAAQLNNIRFKLEEKRRRIESEKRRMELALNKQRQALGQQAFLQALSRDTNFQRQLATLGKPQSAPSGDSKDDSSQIMQDSVEMHGQSVDTVAEQYQQSIAKMNSSLQDIQKDIARLTNQQSQLQQNQLQQHQQHQLHQQQAQLQQQLAQLQANQLLQQQQSQQAAPFQQFQQPNVPQLHNQFSSQHNVSRGPGLNTGFGSTPHIPRDYQEPRDSKYPEQYRDGIQESGYRDINQTLEQYGSPRQFFLHDTPPQPQRRTWAQQAQMQYQDNAELRGWQQSQNHLVQPQQQQLPQHQSPSNQYQPQLPEPDRSRTWKAASPQPPPHLEPRTWKSPSPQPPPQIEPRTWKTSSPQPPPQIEPRTWKSPSPQPPERNWNQGFTLHERNQQFPVQYNNGDPQNHLSYTVINQNYNQTSPQRRSKTPQRQGSLPEPPRRSEPVSLQQLGSPVQPPDDMEPQNISFIGNAEDDALRQGINRLNISSGTRTYRIPSPTRPSLNRNSFQQLEQEEEKTEKGFYISFDNDQPKRPKPPLRQKRGSPKKERSIDLPTPDRCSPEDRVAAWNDRVPSQVKEEEFVVHRATNVDAGRFSDVPERRETPLRERTQIVTSEPAALVIGDSVDPNSAEEMERKKERIMLLSLQRRQRAEESRARAEAAALARRSHDEAVAEQKAARKEEQARRREIILSQYKLKKALEEAEREGKVIDKSEYMNSLRASGMPAPTSTAGAARLRHKGANARTRPKTIHVDSGALQAAEGLLGSKQPSSTNLTAGSSTMKRDYYRGSQDSLAERAGLYRDSPMDDRGAMSPSSNSSGPLGRRGSCKTSRERVNEEPQVRGRSKYSTYQSNFKTGRKSSSLMNLCDSGLGRATPPRRAPSPGVRTLPSPAGSGPGSLPGGIGKRRPPPNDDNSDASSQHSSIMDYSGPRLYKQPATKSNRGIMLNAVEYCVFPGAVNADAKLRVLEEIARSEAKHFLVLFRDAGCQFRALYSFCPDTEQVTKLYGTGPKNVNDRMFDKFFKYNSGSKRFSQIHTKHLTVTIDAFTIHNSLWQGKKVQHPSKKDMALVI